MSGSKRRSGRKRQAAKVRPDPVQFWCEDESPREPDLIRYPIDPTANLRSIGAPSVPNGENAANEFLKTAIKASSLVGALATSMDLFEDDLPTDTP